MTDKIKTIMLLVVMTLVCAIIFAGGALIHYANAADALICGTDGSCRPYKDERSTFTDRNGHFSGSSITHGNKTDFYDARGHYEGTNTRQGTPSNPLGNVDGSDPFGRKR